MATYEYKAPNGKTYTLEGPDGISEETIESFLYTQDPTVFNPSEPTSVPKEGTPGFFESAIDTSKSLLSSTRTGLGALVGDADEAALAGAERQQELSENTRHLPTFDELKQVYQDEGFLRGTGNVISNIPGYGGQAIPTLLSSTGGGRLGATVGSLFGPGGTAIGAGAGAILANTPFLFGGNLERQAQEQQARGEDVGVDTAKAGVSALGQSALEGVGAAATIGPRLLSKVVGRDVFKSGATEAVKAKARDKLRKEAERSLLAASGRGAARAAAGNLPVDIAQQVIERSQAGLDILDDDALREYSDVAVASALGSGALGAGTGPFSRSSARSQLRAEEGENVGEEQIAPERLAQLQAEQGMSPAQAREARLAEIREGRPLDVSDDVVNEMQNYASRPLGLERSDNELQTEVAQLRRRLAEVAPQVGDNKKGRDFTAPLVGRINALEQEINDRIDLAELPARDAARRRKENEQAVRNLPRELQARELARASLEAAYGDRDIIQNQAALRDLNKIPNKERTEEQKQLRSVLQDIVRRQKQEQTERIAQESEQRRLRQEDARRRAQDSPQGEQAQESARVFMDRAAREEVAGLDQKTARKQYVDLGKKKQLSMEEQALHDALGEVISNITPNKLEEAGFDPKSSLFKGLVGKDPNNKNHRKSVRNLIDRVMEKGANSKDAEAIRTLLQHPTLQDSGLQELLPYRDASEIPPGAPIGPREMQAMGIRSNSNFFKNLHQMIKDGDISNPADRSAFLDELVTYRDTKGRPEGVRQKIDDYLSNAAPERVRVPQTQRPTPTGEPVQIEATVRRPNEPVRSTRQSPQAQATQEQLDLDLGFAPETTPAQDLQAAREMFEKQQSQDKDNIFEGMTPEEIEAANNNPKVVGGDAYNAASSAGDIAGVYTPEFVVAINEGRTTDALNMIVSNDTGIFSPVEAAVAQRMLRGGGEMPNIEIVDSIITRNGERASGEYDTRTDTVRLVKGEADSHTFLHELMHAYTHKLLQREVDKARPNTHVQELQKLYDTVKEVFNERGSNVNAIYGMNNLSEFVAEAFSNRGFQLALMSVPWQTKTVWGRFKDKVKEILGVVTNNPVDNALFAALVHAEGLMSPGRALQMTNDGIPVPNPYVQQTHDILVGPGELTGEELLQLRRAPDQQHRSEGKKFLSHFKGSLHGTDAVTRIRTRAVDNFASVEGKLSSVFSQGLRDAFGNINPMVMARQAADKRRVALQVYRKGGMRKNNETNTYEAYTLVDENGVERSPAGAISIMRDMAKRFNTSYDEVKSRVASVLEGMRQYELREENNRIEAEARALESDGSREGIEKAFKLRQNKVLLHMLNAEIEQFRDVFNRSTEIQEIQKHLNATRFNLIDNLVSSGRISQKFADQLKSFINYVPLDRVQEVFESADLVSTTGLHGLGIMNAFPTLKGSFTRPAANVVDNYMNTIAWMVGQAIQNDASTQLLAAMVNAGYAQRVTAENPATNSDLVSPKVFIKGEPVQYQLESEYDLAAFAQSNEPNGAIVNGLAYTARILRATITAIPTFSLNMNIQDTVRVGMQSGTKSIPTAGLLLVKFPSIIFKSWRGQQSATGEILHDQGTVGNFDYNPIDPLSALEHELGASNYNSFQKLMYRLEQIAKASDQASREAVYERTMKETGDEALAHMRAREYINYSRRGASKTAKVLTRTVAFFNSYAQGLDLVYRGVTGRSASSGLAKGAAKRYVLGRMGLMFGVALAYAMAMQGDEDYDNAPDYIKHKGWLLPKSITSAFDGEDGRHTPLIIPYPREYGFLLKSVPETIVQFYNDSAKGEDREAWDVVKNLLSVGADTYVMQPMPPGIRQVLEYTTNHSFFTGRELVAEHQQKQPTVQQINNETSMLAEQLGKATGLSPIKLDNLLRGTFGTAGALTMKVYDAMFSDAVPEQPINKIPSLSAFFAPEVGNKLVNDYYDLKNKVDLAVNGANALKGNPQAYAEFVNEHRNYLALKSYINAKAKQISKINKMRTALMRDPDLNMTPKERRNELRRLEKLRQDLLRDVPSVRGQAVRQE